MPINLKQIVVYAQESNFAIEIRYSDKIVSDLKGKKQIDWCYQTTHITHFDLELILNEINIFIKEHKKFFIVVDLRKVDSKKLINSFIIHTPWNICFT